jgi:hypothetical protein
MNPNARGGVRAEPPDAAAEPLNQHPDDHRIPLQGSGSRRRVQVSRGCSYPGCENDVRARSMCVTHYNREWERTNPRSCGVAGCRGQYYAAGWCCAHYYRKQRAHRRAQLRAQRAGLR